MFHDMHDLGLIIMYWLYFQSHEATPNVTGYLEVHVNGKLIHSKKVSGLRESRMTLTSPLENII